MKYPRIFSVDSAKAIKAQEFGYLNAIQYMAPANSSGKNLCSHASPGCIAICLGWFSGQASMVTDLEAGTNAARDSRLLKSRLFMSERPIYLNQIVCGIVDVIRAANRQGLKPCIRLNGSTDLAFERFKFDLNDKTAAKVLRLFAELNLCPPVCPPSDKIQNVTIHGLFSFVQFVDYTKVKSRFKTAPANLNLTFSRSEINLNDCLEVLAQGHNVAVVFGDTLPKTLWGYDVINGDLHDLRHLDRQGVIVGLSPKGHKAKHDISGFVFRGAVPELELAA